MQWSCNLALCSTRMLVKNSKSIRPLGWTPKELLDTVDDLKARDVNLISLEERTATTSASGELVIAARNSFSPSRPRQRWKIRLSGRQATWYRQINSLQGYQKRGSVIHVPPWFLLSVNLHTNLPIRPSSSSLVDPGQALRHRPTRWIGSSPLPQPMCHPWQARCVNNSVRMSLDAWGASLLPDIPGAPFQMIRLPIASSDEAR